LFSQIYPPSAINLNLVSKQMDVDVYSDDGSTKMDVKGMKVDIQIILGRMKSKNPNHVNVPGKFKQKKITFSWKIFFQARFRDDH